MSMRTTADPSVPPTVHWATSAIIQRIGWVGMLLMMAISQTGCRSFQLNSPREILAPSNNRDWDPQLSKLPFAEASVTSNDDVVHLHNIRKCRYLTEDDYLVEHYNRSFNLNDVQTVDFVVVPFDSAPALAHTMFSFGLTDGTHLAVSVETRKERGERFNAALGFLRQYELAYVIGDEQDLIRLRTDHRKSDVFVYPTVASPEQARQLLVGVLDRINELAHQPEFYHSITNNCTTNLVSHVNEISPNKIPYNWKVLLPGFSAKYAYDLGLLDNSIPLEDLSAIAYVNPLADGYTSDKDYSATIRKRFAKLPVYREREFARRDLIRGAGDEYLAERPRNIFRR